MHLDEKRDSKNETQVFTRVTGVTERHSGEVVSKNERAKLYRILVRRSSDTRTLDDTEEWKQPGGGGVRT
jgi:hypothetical protein